MSVVTLTINDNLVSAQEGQSLLAVIRENNIELPTLCHLEGLSDRGGCGSVWLKLPVAISCWPPVSRRCRRVWLSIRIPSGWWNIAR